MPVRGRVSWLINNSTRADESEQDVVSRLAELDMVAADLTRANERVAAVERRNVRGPKHLVAQ